MKKPLLLFTLLLPPLLWIGAGGEVYAQKKGQELIDSLQTVLTKTKQDTIRVGILNRMSDESCWLANYDIAHQYANSALELAEKLDFKKGIIIAHNNIAHAYFFQGYYPEAIDNSFAALKVAEKAGNKNEMARAYNTIGKVYSRQDDFSKAVENYKKSIAMMKDLGNKDGMARAHNNIAIVYTHMGKYDKSLKSYTLAFKFMKEIGDITSQYIINNNMGELYFKMGDYPKALEKSFASLKVFDSIGNDRGKALAYFNIGTSYVKLGQTQEGKKWLQKSLVANKELGIKEFIEDTYKSLAKADSIMEDFSSSLENYKLYIIYRDSLINEQNTRELTRAQMQYEFDKKEAIAQAVREKKDLQQRTVRNSLIAGLSAFFLFSVLVYRQRNKVKKEKKRSDDLLLNILPEEVATELKTTGTSEARHFESVSIMFTDFKEFTILAEKISSKELIQELNHCFKAFDKIITKHGIEKIKTIGDAYMAVCGLPVPQDNHAKKMIEAALEIRDFMENYKQKRTQEGKSFFEMRIGINSGEVVAGIVGIKKFAYDIWGDAVNIAARMESNGEVGKINISESTHNLVKNDFNFEYRGEIEAKGKGKIGMYFAEPKTEPI